MRNLIFLSVFIFCFGTACGGDNGGLTKSRELGDTNHEYIERDKSGNEIYRGSYLVTREKLPSSNEQKNSYSDGVYFSVKNLLSNQRPDVSFEVCSYSLESSGKRDDKLCFVSENLIKYGKSKNFFLSRNDLSRLLGYGEGRKFAIKFNDNYSRSLTHWGCWDYRTLEVNDLDKLSEFKIEVTQINNLSYSCRVNQGDESSNHDNMDNRYADADNLLPNIQDQSQDGRYFTISNMLADSQSNLSIKFCSYHIDSEQEKNGLCYVSEKLVSFGKNKQFYLSSEKLHKLLSYSNGDKIKLRFNDNSSYTSVHWGCWDHPYLQIDLENKKLSYDVEVTQANTASYSCRIHASL